MFGRDCGFDVRSLCVQTCALLCSALEQEEDMIKEIRWKERFAIGSIRADATVLARP